MKTNSVISAIENLIFTNRRLVIALFVIVTAGMLFSLPFDGLTCQGVWPTYAGKAMLVGFHVPWRLRWVVCIVALAIALDRCFLNHRARTMLLL